MGFCDDKSLTLLKGLGYNVVRHPNAAVKPLDLIGWQSGQSIYLGPLNLLITNPPGPLPALKPDIPSADINGQSSSKLSFGIGANILGAVVGAMGANLGVDLKYTNAKKVEFQYSGVLNDSVVPLDVGNYLRDGDVDAGNLILKQYVLGNGRLYLITKTAKSKKFTVKYELGNGAAAKVEVPVIRGVLGGHVGVTADAQNANVVTFEGGQSLTFGFQCFRVDVKDGNLSLTSMQPGGVALAVGGAGADKPALLTDDGLLDLGSL